VTREQLAELIGVSLTRRLQSGHYWRVTPPGVMVRKLAADVAADIEGEVLNAREGSR
jgi:hypothetical protein